jgi:hypothetical protein
MIVSLDMATGNATVVHEIRASHEPQLSRPDELADLLVSLGR